MADIVHRHKIAPSEITAIGKACQLSRDSLDALGTRIAGDTVCRSWEHTRDTLVNSLRQANVETNDKTRLGVFRNYWRLALATGDRVQTIGSQVSQRGSPLRAVGEAITWFSKKGPRPQSTRTQRLTSMSIRRSPKRPPPDPQPPLQTGGHAHSPSHGERAARPTAKRDPKALATDHSLMFRALCDVLSEMSGQPASQFAINPNSDVPDEILAAVRDMGFPMPAPKRLGKKNSDAPISERAREAVKSNLAEFLKIISREQPGTIELEEYVRPGSGVAVEVEGQFANQRHENTGQPLTEFCQDSDGNVNQALLKNLTLLAFRAGTRFIEDVCLNDTESSLALFIERPVKMSSKMFIRVCRDSDYDVVLDIARNFIVEQVKTRTKRGRTTTVKLDPQSSNIAVSIRYKLDATTGTPTIENTSIGYAFHLPAKASSK